MDREMNELTPNCSPGALGLPICPLLACDHPRDLYRERSPRRLLEAPLYSTRVGLRHVIPPTTSSAEATTFATIQ